MAGAGKACQSRPPGRDFSKCQPRLPGRAGIFQNADPGCRGRAGTPKNGRDPGKPGLWPGTWSTPTCKTRFKPISGRLRRVIMKSFIRKFPVPATSQSRHLPGLKCLAGAGPGRARGSTPAAGPGRDFSECQPRLAGAGPGSKKGPGSRQTGVTAGIPVDP